MVKTEVVPTTVKLEIFPRTIEVPNPDYKHFIKDSPIQFKPPKTLPMEIQVRHKHITIIRLSTIKLTLT